VGFLGGDGEAEIGQEVEREAATGSTEIVAVASGGVAKRPL